MVRGERSVHLARKRLEQDIRPRRCEQNDDSGIALRGERATVVSTKGRTTAHPQVFGIRRRWLGWEKTLFVQYRFYIVGQIGELARDDVPQNLIVHAEVSMNESIAQTR